MSYQKPELLDPAPTGDTVKEAILKTDANVDDIYWSLNDILSKIPGAQNPQQLLDAIKTVDGSGSGLDADYLDGIDSTGFELALGNPAVDGWVLSSGTNGVRSWVPMTTGGGGELPTWEEIIAIMAPHDGNGSTIDADMVDGIHASGFAQSGHNHNDATPTASGFMSVVDKVKLDDMSDPALLEEFRAFSAGVADAGMPIKLDDYGVLDVSFISIKIFNLEGDWTPTAGNEYPAPADPGDYWIIENVGDIISGGYTFTSGFLSGKTIYDNELLVKGRDDKWGIIHMKVDPNLYYRLDGTNHLTADFQAGGHKLSNIAAGTVATDAVNKSQLDAELGSFLPLTGGTLTGSLIVNNNTPNSIIISQDIIVSSDDTVHLKALTAQSYSANIASGVTDNGYRVGLDVSCFFSNPEFQGTLSTQYALWCRHGHYGAAAGHIENSFGIYIDSLEGGTTVVDNLFALYQKASNAKNVFNGLVTVNNQLVVSHGGPAIILGSTGSSYVQGLALDGSFGWYFGRGRTNSNDVLFFNYISGDFVSLPETGGFTFRDFEVWHAGNFDPDTKLGVNDQAVDTALFQGYETTAFEFSLGNPSVAGYVLSSDTAGNRSWVEMAGGGTPAPVDSVNGKTGVVVLDAADVGAAPASHGHAEYLEKAGDTMTGFLNTNGHSDNATTLSSGSGSRTIDLSLGNFFSHDNGGGSASYSISVPSGSAGGFCFVIYLSGSGAKSFSNAVWVNGKAPDNSNGVAVLFNDSGGAGNWIGAWGPM